MQNLKRKQQTKSKKEPKAPKPKRVSLPTTIAPADVTLELAMQLAELPKMIGVHPDGGPISVGYGKFGPYVKFEDIFASIPKTMDFLTVTVEDAVDLIAKKKAKPPRTAGKGRAAKASKLDAVDGDTKIVKTPAKKLLAKKTTVKKKPAVKKVPVKKASM